MIGKTTKMTAAATTRPPAMIRSPRLRFLSNGFMWPGADDGHDRYLHGAITVLATIGIFVGIRMVRPLQRARVARTRSWSDARAAEVAEGSGDGGTIGPGVIQRRPEVLRGHEMFLAVVAFVIVYSWAGDASAAMGFYEASAQIIPILLLALVVGSRLRVSGLPEIDSRIIVAAVLALIIGEVECLDVLANGEANERSFALVAAALSAAGISVVLPALVGADGPEDSRDNNPR